MFYGRFLQINSLLFYPSWTLRHQVEDRREKLSIGSGACARWVAFTRSTTEDQPRFGRTLQFNKVNPKFQPKRRRYPTWLTPSISGRKLIITARLWHRRTFESWCYCPPHQRNPDLHRKCTSSRPWHVLLADKLSLHAVVALPSSYGRSIPETPNCP